MNILLRIENPNHVPDNMGFEEVVDDVWVYDFNDLITVDEALIQVCELAPLVTGGIKFFHIALEHELNEYLRFTPQQLENLSNCNVILECGICC
ncbi:hypothetical protein Rhal01_03717 [Rubritalea halochordaticola]|uniref:Uncharacterized protein n=1 Tax=Rubritalea halochordaticola TaxID=714537 RepID=A0ABP9V4B9_9BACT